MTEVAATATPKKRTAPRDVRRKQLIMAAMDSISKRGFSDTTLRHVTEKAKLSHGVVNYHFESKEALYDAILEYLAKEYFDLWSKNLNEAGPDPAEQLTALISADFDKKICTPKRMAVWFAFWGQAKYRPKYLKIHHHYDLKRDEAVQGICRELIADGGYADIDQAWAARTIAALIDGQWLSLMLYPSPGGAAKYRNDCMTAIARIFPKHFANVGMVPGDCGDV